MNCEGGVEQGMTLDLKTAADRHYSVMAAMTHIVLVSFYNKDIL